MAAVRNDSTELAAKGEALLVAKCPDNTRSRLARRVESVRLTLTLSVEPEAFSDDAALPIRSVMADSDDAVSSVECSVRERSCRSRRDPHADVINMHPESNRRDPIIDGVDAATSDDFASTDDPVLKPFPTRECDAASLDPQATELDIQRIPGRKGQEWPQVLATFIDRTLERVSVGPVEKPELKVVPRP